MMNLLKMHIKADWDVLQRCKKVEKAKKKSRRIEIAPKA